MRDVQVPLFHLWLPYLSCQPSLFLCAALMRNDFALHTLYTKTVCCEFGFVLSKEEEQFSEMGQHKKFTQVFFFNCVCNNISNDWVLTLQYDKKKKKTQLDGTNKTISRDPVLYLVSGKIPSTIQYKHFRETVASVSARRTDRQTAQLLPSLKTT